LPVLSLLADGGHEFAGTARDRNAFQVPALRRERKTWLAAEDGGGIVARTRPIRTRARAYADGASAMTTIDRLLAQKKHVLDRLKDDDVGANERAELEVVLAKVNTALSLLADGTGSEP
jgi:hypothetical protein